MPAYFLFFLLLFSACKSQPTDSSKPSREENISPQYLFASPRSYVELPKELHEISALRYLAEDKLLALQDEDGILYQIDALSGQIIGQQSFAGPGDFEGLALGPEAIYALRSDGRLYMLRNVIQSNSLVVDSLDLPFSEANDLEGLEYHAPSHSLLIACKGSASLGKEEEQSYRAIYRFSLADMHLEQEPYLRITRSDLQALSDSLGFADAKDEYLQKLAKKLKKTEKKQKDKEQEPQLRALPFKPSALSLHPISGDLYILSASPRPSVLIYDTQSKSYSNWIFLNEDYYPKPEGLCFSPEGRLYLSSEGKKHGYLGSYDMQKGSD